MLKEVGKAVGKAIFHASIAFGFGITMWLIMHGNTWWLQFLSCLNLGIYFTLLLNRFDFLERTNDLTYKLVGLIVNSLEKHDKKEQDAPEQK